MAGEGEAEDTAVVVPDLSGSALGEAIGLRKLSCTSCGVSSWCSSASVSLPFLLRRDGILSEMASSDSWDIAKVKKSKQAQEIAAENR